MVKKVRLYRVKKEKKKDKIIRSIEPINIEVPYNKFQKQTQYLRK